MALPSPKTKRTIAELVGLTFLIASLACGLFILGLQLSNPLLKLAGFMTGASTFVPMPADAYILATAAKENALAVAIVAGGVNAIVVLFEATWIRKAASFSKFKFLHDFIGTNALIQRFQEHFFLGLLLGGLSPLPFEPFRFLAALSSYNRWRYALATFLGRGGRYYCLALAGSAISDLGYINYIVAASLVLFAVGVLRSSIKAKRKNAAE